MKSNGVTEIISFEIQNGYSEEDINIGLLSLDNFYKNYEGYYGMNILTEGSTYTLIIGWESKDIEKHSSSKMMGSDDTVVFKRLVNPHTVKKNIYSSFML